MAQRVSSAALLVANLPLVLVFAPHFGTSTRVQVTIHKVKAVAILKTGSIVNVIVSRFACKIKMVPYLNHVVVYGTVCTASTELITAYSAPPTFQQACATAPAVVLENEQYNLLIIILFMKEFEAIVNYQDGFFYLLVIALLSDLLVYLLPRTTENAVPDFLSTLHIYCLWIIVSLNPRFSSLL